MSLDVYLSEVSEHCVFDSNITHNLNNMADAAGIYEAVWRPEEIGVKTAKELVPILSAGIERMKKNPEKFSELSAKNGWGTYEQFLPWLEEYLVACKEHPDAKISVSR